MKTLLCIKVSPETKERFRRALYELKKKRFEFTADDLLREALAYIEEVVMRR